MNYQGVGGIGPDVFATHGVGGMGPDVFTANHGVGGMGPEVLAKVWVATLWRTIAPVRTTRATTATTNHLLILLLRDRETAGGVYEQWEAVKGKISHTCVVRVHVYPCWQSQCLYLVVRTQVRKGKRRGQEYVGTSGRGVLVPGVLLGIPNNRV